MKFDRQHIITVIAITKLWQILRNFTKVYEILQLKSTHQATMHYNNNAFISHCFTSTRTSGLNDNGNAVCQELKKLSKHKVTVGRYGYNNNNDSIISTQKTTK